MKIQKNGLLVLMVAMLATACKESYDPPVINTNLNLLVVDGFLNNGNDTTTIRLSRTRKLSDGTANSGEPGAQISLLDAAGNPLYFFQETGDGNYIVPGLNLSLTSKYKLHIATAAGKQYESDLIEVRQTPPIDSINWERQPKGVMIYANTHDPQNNTHYYRWDYTETWAYHSAYYSFYKWDNGTVIARDQSDDIYHCWESKNSTDFLLGSSAKLTADLISRAPLRFIANESVELSVKYSVLVRQYAVTKEGYNYFQNLRNINERLGSIFDAQPSQLTGNIHSLSDSTEAVLGYLTASSVNSQRIFIDNLQVTPWPYHLPCEDKIIVKLDSLAQFFGGGLYIPISQYTVRGFVLGYYGGTPECVDCKLEGGTNIKPSFWP